ncbi:MAG: UDP-N-acetylenolpyruvoylglucosamine reductase [Deltaproteobacteria bacterium 37-65-8]|nr:MAG: UDP-N-acetylenolpyruvoylglucosamine reductase [Deltaproteobacteria bacterium 37-65-8]
MSGNWAKAFSRGSGGRGREAGEIVRNIEVVFQVKLREYTTIGIGGAADRLVFPRSAAQVREIVLTEKRSGRPVQVLGAGSNLLVADGGVSATVLCTKKHLSKVVFLSDGSVVAEAGVMLPRLAVLCALSGLSGMEPLSGIPGTVGGALSMNAGAYGQSIGELAEWVEIVDAEGEIHRVEARAIRFGYREANYPVQGIVVRAGFRFGAGTREAVFGRMRQVNEKRRASQPWGEKTFGSAFRNPPEGAGKARELLERAGMKGEREGDACFSGKHANFLVNLGRATAADVRRLLSRGQSAVRVSCGVLLLPEVKMWGDFDV